MAFGSTFQAQVCPPGSIHLCASVNVDKVVSKGIELSAFGKLPPELTVNAGYLFNPTQYPAGYLAADGTELSGRQLAFTARHKLTLSGTYERSLSDRVKGFLSLDAVYRSGMQLYATTAPEAYYGANWVMGGEAGLRIGKDLKLLVFARNITNKAVPAIIAPSPFNGVIGTSYQQYFTAASKRAVGLALSLDF